MLYGVMHGTDVNSYNSVNSCNSVNYSHYSCDCHSRLAPICPSSCQVRRRNLLYRDLVLEFYAIVNKSMIQTTNMCNTMQAVFNPACNGPGHIYGMASDNDMGRRGSSSSEEESSASSISVAKPYPSVEPLVLQSTCKYIDTQDKND